MSFEKVKNSEQNSESVNKIEYKYGVLYVELLFEEIPEISADKILNDMRAVCGNVDLMMNTKEITGFLFKDYIWYSACLFIKNIFYLRFFQKLKI